MCQESNLVALTQMVFCVSLQALGCNPAGSRVWGFLTLTTFCCTMCPATLLCKFAPGTGNPRVHYQVSLMQQAENIAAGHHVLGETSSGGAQQTSYSNYSNSSFSSNNGGGNTGAMLQLSFWM